MLELILRTLTYARLSGVLLCYGDKCKRFGNKAEWREQPLKGPQPLKPAGLCVNTHEQSKAKTKAKATKTQSVKTRQSKAKAGATLVMLAMQCWHFRSSHFLSSTMRSNSDFCVCVSG
jgi:hypothetical protein